MPENKDIWPKCNKIIKKNKYIIYHCPLSNRLNSEKLNHTLELLKQLFFQKNKPSKEECWGCVFLVILTPGSLLMAKILIAAMVQSCTHSLWDKREWGGDLKGKFTDLICLHKSGIN